MPKLTANSYGKSAVRLTKVVRNNNVHAIHEMDVEILLEGNFENVYTQGDNNSCIPTDTMKNTVYALAKKHDFDSPEQFATILTEHFIDAFMQVISVVVTIEQTTWDRIDVDNKPHDHAFVKGAGKRLVIVEASRFSDWPMIQGGIRNLEVVKTTNSGFVGFLRDQYTSLKETTDRIFGTSIEAIWTYNPEAANYNQTYTAARTAILKTFATHNSLAVQQTLFEMGKAVLAAAKEISDISFSLPNQHRILANLEPFNLTNQNEIFVNTSEPYGLIRGTITRE
jgi:urate oxidase